MFPGGKNINNLMKQAKKMQQDMQKRQEELESSLFEASAGGGMVKVVMNGKYQLKELHIDPQAVDPDDVEMLEDLILAAFTEVHEKIEAESSDAMSKLTGGMSIPGLF